MLEALVGCSDKQGADGTDSADFEIDWDLEAVEAEGTLAGAPRLPLPTYLRNCLSIGEADQAGEVTPWHDSSCSSQVDEVVEEAARSCDSDAAAGAEVQGYKAALNPSLGDSMEISALVCIPVGSDSFVLLEKGYCGKDSVVQ